MNGRCESDPLDIAEDVCNSCGGEFCSSCLLQPKGRSTPVCRECAIALAGVRSKSKIVRKQSKSDAKKARKRLQAAAAENVERSGFMFFDADPDFERSAIDDPAPPVPASADLLEEEEKRSGGLLGRLRRKTDKPEEDGPPPDREALQVTLGGPDEPDSEQSGMPTATELLSRLKEREELGFDGSTTADEPADVDPNDIWLPPVAPGGDGPNLPVVDQDFAGSQDFAGDQDLVGERDFLGEDSAPADPGQRSSLDPSEPAAAEPPARVIPPPSPQAPAPAPAPPPAAAPVPAAASFASEMAPPVFVSEKELKKAAKEKGPADQDEHGDWVPPTLRGIVPKEQRDSQELPRRRK